MSEQEEKKSKKGSLFKIIAIILVLGDVSLLIIGLVKIFSGIAEPNIDLKFELINSGMIFIWAFGGVLIILIPALTITFILSRAKSFTKTFNNIPRSSPNMDAYSASYRPSKRGNIYYCDYCGYEVKSHERECPECSGPIKRGKRVA